MKKMFAAFFSVLLVLWDAASVILSVIIAFHLRFGLTGNVPSYYENFRVLYIITYFVILFIFNLIFKCYVSVWKHAGLNEAIRMISSVLLTGTTVFAADRIAGAVIPHTASTHLANMFGLPIEVLIIISLLILVFTLAGRLSVRFILTVYAWVGSSRMRPEMTRVLIYGAGEAGTYLVKKLMSNPKDKLLPVAFVDDNTSMWGRKVSGVRVAGGHEKLEQIIEKYDVEEVIVAIPSAPKDLLKDILEHCKNTHCALRRFGTIDDVEQKNMDVLKIANINLEELLRRDSVKLNMDVVQHFIEGKTVLVTGGAGSIGSEICRQVLRFGAKKLLIFDINENGLFDIENELKEKFGRDRFVPLLGSIRDRKRVEEVFLEYSPQIVFHAAAHKHVPMMEGNPREAIKNNVFGTMNVAQTAILFGAEKFILISTDKAVNPTNIMGASKRIAEQEIQMLGNMCDTGFAAVRFGNVLGSNGSVVPFFRKQIEHGGPVTVTHKDMKRYFMTIPEAVQLVLEAGAMAKGGEIFVLDMGSPVKIYDLACDLIKLSGYEPNKDIDIVITGLRPGEKLFEEISLADEDVSKTANDKIFVCKPIPNDHTELACRIKALQDTIGREDLHDMFESVHDLVPTFKHDKLN